MLIWQLVAGYVALAATRSGQRCRWARSPLAPGSADRVHGRNRPRSRPPWARGGRGGDGARPSPPGPSRTPVRAATYPAIWSFQLALRTRGLGTTITGITSMAQGGGRRSAVHPSGRDGGRAAPHRLHLDDRVPPAARPRPRTSRTTSPGDRRADGASLATRGAAMAPQWPEARETASRQPLW